MSITEIGPLEALSPGCELWFLAGLAESTWTRKIDWYLNFQIRRANRHSPKDLSSEMRKVITEFDVTVPSLDRNTTLSTPPKFENLMVASQRLLPNSKTVLIPYTSETGAKARWLSECKTVWKNLGQPPVRFFLPDELNAKLFIRDLENSWERPLATEVQVVGPPELDLSSFA